MPQQPAPAEPNRVKIRIVFSGKGRETTIDLDSYLGCKSVINGQLYPDDMALVASIMKLVNDAKATYPPAS